MGAREPAVAGMFYPKRADEIEEMMEGFSKATEGDASAGGERGDVHGIVVPHAGYIYSGPTAAQGFELVKDKRYDLIILLGPSHSFGFRGIAMDDNESWKTPLGKRTVDYRPVFSGIAHDSEPLFMVSAAAHAPEHSLEVQLPFLQHFRVEGPIAPLLVGIVDDGEAERIADALAGIASKHHVLFVVSTDLSHYLSRDERLTHDKRSIKIIEKLKTDDFADLDACGKHPLRILMHLCRLLQWKPALVHESDSGDASGDTKRVVGYASMAF